MLRLAIARSTCRRVSTTVRWSRWQSTTSGSDSKRAESSKDTSTLSLLKRMSGKDAVEIPEELANPTEEAPESEFPSVAETDVELFGTQEQVDHRALGLKYDPAMLPLRQQLDPYNRPYTEEEYSMTLVHGRSVHEPFFHPRTHDIPVASIHFRSHHVELLNLFTHFATHAASSLGIPVSRVASLPTKRTLWTVPRSPFVHKKSQENFERKVHKRAIKAWDADPEVVQRWITYLRTNALAGIGMRVTTWDRVPLGIGASHVVLGKDVVENPTLDAPKKIEQLGRKIVEEEQKGVSRA